jgi:hypothetical protein
MVCAIWTAIGSNQASAHQLDGLAPSRRATPAQVVLGAGTPVVLAERRSSTREANERD